MFEHQLSSGGVFVEKFLAGREFTVLIAGDSIKGTTAY
jgi:hypothetical protein